MVSPSCDPPNRSPIARPPAPPRNEPARPPMRPYGAICCCCAICCCAICCCGYCCCGYCWCCCTCWYCCCGYWACGYCCWDDAADGPASQGEKRCANCPAMPPNC